MLDAACESEDRAVADGGFVDTDDTESVQDDKGTECIGDFPCWECYRTEKKQVL